MNACVKAGLSTLVGWIAYMAVKKAMEEVLEYTFPAKKA